MSQGIRNNKEVADRYNQDKIRWSLVDYEALKPMVEVLAFGAKKYSDDNWKKGLKTKEVCESLMRHLTAYLSGQDNDSESDLPEVGHILCNAMFLSHMHLFRPDMDTRAKKNACCGDWDELGNCTCKRGVKENVEVQTEEYFDSSGKSINDFQKRKYQMDVMGKWFKTPEDAQKYIYDKTDYERLVEKWGEDKARELLGITP